MDDLNGIHLLPDSMIQSRFGRGAEFGVQSCVWSSVWGAAQVDLAYVVQ